MTKQLESLFNFAPLTDVVPTPGESKEFIEENKDNLICPKIIADRKKKNIHETIPANKYSLNLKEKCLNKPAKNCDISGSKSASYNNNPYITLKNRKGRKARRHSRRSKYLV